MSHAGENYCGDCVVEAASNAVWDKPVPYDEDMAAERKAGVSQKRKISSISRRRSGLFVVEHGA